MQPATTNQGYRDPPGFRVPACGIDIAVLTRGEERLEALLELINSAQVSLQLFSYIYAEDHSGRLVRDALAAAAERGVSVHLMVDDFGSSAPDTFFSPIEQAGGKFSRFSARWNVRYLIRNHQKFAIADRQCAILGGFNIGDEYFALGDQGQNWSDIGFRITGQVTAQLARWFDKLADWVSDPQAQYWAMRQMLRQWHPGGGNVQLLIGGPTMVANSWARSLRRDLAKAQRLDLVMAYFSPPQTIRRLIRNIGQSGSARLVLAGKSDNSTTINAARALYSAMLKKGVEIHEFNAQKLHSKLIIIDDVVYCGSANCDMRSLRINIEVMLRIEDRALADRLRGLAGELVQGSTLVSPDLHRKRAGLPNRLRWRFCWLLVGVLDYTITRRLNF